MSTDPATVAQTGRCERLRWLAGALAAAWLLPALTHLLGVDWLLVPVFLVAVAAVQRGLRTGLDGLVVGLAQTFGALCLAGLAYSAAGVLHPVPVAGTAFSLLAGLAAARGRMPGATHRRSGPGRRPRWPGRPGVADLLVGLAALGVTALTVLPFAARDLGGRLGLLAVGEDLARHVVLVDQIGHLRGYVFLFSRTDAALLPAGQLDGMRAYPQGVHYAYAVLDRFLRSSGGDGSAVGLLDAVIWLYVATFAFLALAVLWSANRVAGAGPRPAQRLAVLTVVAGWIYFGEPLAVFVRGFPNELIGLALAAVLTAVVVRPLTSASDQLVTVSLLVVGVSFSYHLFLPYAGVAALLWAVRTGAWRRLPVVVTGSVTLVAAAVTPLLNLDAASARQLTIAGTALATDRPAAAVLLAAAAAGTVARRGFRSPGRRAGASCLAAVVLLLAGLGAFQLMTLGHTVYYFDKLLHLTTVVGLVLLGSWTRLVPGRGRLPRVTAAFVVAVTLLALAGAGGAGHRTVPGHGVRLATGLEKGSPAGGRDALFLARRPADGAVDVDLMDTPYRNFYGTLFASVLQRNYRYGHVWYDFLNPSARPKTLADLERLVEASPVTVRFHVHNPAASLLVSDPDSPDRQWTRPGADPASFGDPAALSNVEAARHLARRYPGRVEVIDEIPPDR